MAVLRATIHRPSSPPRPNGEKRVREISVQLVSKLTRADPRWVGEVRAVLARLADLWKCLADEPAERRHVTFSAAVDSEIAAVIQKAAVNLPCSKGCNHCCKFNVIFVNPHEAVALVRAIEALAPPRRAAVVARILASRGSSGGGIGSPCVLLEIEGCAIYASRPLACRGYYSLSEAACRRRLIDGADGAIPPTLLAPRVVEFAALEVSNPLQHPPYEINALLRRIYSDPARIERWRNGEPTSEPDLLQGVHPGQAAASRKSW
jgi:Fe-S-cluster containining protein